MQNKETVTKLIKAVETIAKDVRYGNFSTRLSCEKFSGFEGIVEDINNMIESIEDRENMIKEYQNFLKQKSLSLIGILNNMREGIITLDKNYNIVQINLICSRWFHLSQNKLLNKNILEIIKKYDITSYPNNNKNFSLNSFFSNKKSEFELKFVQNDNYRIFKINIIKYTNINKETQYLVVSKDITKIKELENLKNTFKATLTHDLKVPILAQSNIYNLMKNESFGELNSMQKSAIENLIDSNNDLMTLVSNLLNVYSIEEGEFKINKSRCDIKAILDSEIKKLSFFTTDCNKKIELKFFETDFFVNADKLAISRVFKNILANAINYSNKNSTIVVKLKKTAKYICISVENDGIGIRKGDLSKIFEKYYSSTEKFRKAGSGLGLYLSKKIIDLHNGKISVKSTPDVKTEFLIKLPIDIK